MLLDFYTGWFYIAYISMFIIVLNFNSSLVIWPTFSFLSTFEWMEAYIAYTYVSQLVGLDLVWRGLRTYALPRKAFTVRPQGDSSLELYSYMPPTSQRHHQLVCPAHPTNARLNWDLGNLEAMSTSWTWVPQIIFGFRQGALSCWKTPWWCHQGIQFPKRVSTVCNNAKVDATCQSNIHMNGRTQGFPAEHCPKHHTASAGLPSSHTRWCNVFPKYTTHMHPVTHVMLKKKLFIR